MHLENKIDQLDSLMIEEKTLFGSVHQQEMKYPALLMPEQAEQTRNQLEHSKLATMHLCNKCYPY